VEKISTDGRPLELMRRWR